jgi:hypothetical protein
MIDTYVGFEFQYEFDDLTREDLALHDEVVLERTTRECVEVLLDREVSIIGVLREVREVYAA